MNVWGVLPYVLILILCLINYFYILEDKQQTEQIIERKLQLPTYAYRISKRICYNHKLQMK